MKYTIDRIEGMQVVCEDENREIINIPLHALPFDAVEGATFEKNSEGIYALIDDTARHERIEKLMDDLWN